MVSTQRKTTYMYTICKTCSSRLDFTCQIASISEDLKFQISPKKRAPHPDDAYTPKFKKIYKTLPVVVCHGLTLCSSHTSPHPSHSLMLSHSHTLKLSRIPTLSHTLPTLLPLPPTPPGASHRSECPLLGATHLAGHLGGGMAVPPSSD